MNIKEEITITLTKEETETVLTEYLKTKGYQVVDKIDFNLKSVETDDYYGNNREEFHNVKIQVERLTK